MKGQTTIPTFLVLLIIVSGCSFLYERGEPIFEETIEYYKSGKVKQECDGYFVRKYNEEGQLTEVYGNEKAFDNDQNIKELYFYSDSLLIEKHIFFLDDTTDFVIKDSSEFRNEKYYYDESGTVFMLVFFADYDSTGFTGKRIFYWGESSTTKKILHSQDLPWDTLPLDTDEAEIGKLIEMLKK